MQDSWKLVHFPTTMAAPVSWFYDVTKHADPNERMGLPPNLIIPGSSESLEQEIRKELNISRLDDPPPPLPNAYLVREFRCEEPPHRGTVELYLPGEEWPVSIRGDGTEPPPPGFYPVHFSKPGEALEYIYWIVDANESFQVSIYQEGGLHMRFSHDAKAPPWYRARFGRYRTFFGL